MVGLKCKVSKGFDPFMIKCGNSTADVAALRCLVRRLFLCVVSQYVWESGTYFFIVPTTRADNYLSCMDCG